MRTVFCWLHPLHSMETDRGPEGCGRGINWGRAFVREVFWGNVLSCTLALVVCKYYFFFFFLEISFIYSWETQGEGEAVSLRGSLVRDLIPKSRIRTWAESIRSTTEPLRGPEDCFSTPQSLLQMSHNAQPSRQRLRGSQPSSRGRGDLRGLGLLALALWALLAMGSLWAGEWRQFLRCAGAFVFSCIAGVHLFCRERFWTPVLSCWDVAARPAWLISSTKCWAVEAAKTCVWSLKALRWRPCLASRVRGASCPWASRSGGGGPPSPRHLSGTKLANLGPRYHIPDRSQKDPQSKSGRGFCCWETRGTGDRDFAAGGEEARRSGRGTHLAGLSLESWALGDHPGRLAVFLLVAPQHVPRSWNLTWGLLRPTEQQNVFSCLWTPSYLRRERFTDSFDVI